MPGGGAGNVYSRQYPSGDESGKNKNRDPTSE